MNAIVDEISWVVQNMKTLPAQMIYGHEQEITNRLLQQQNNPQLKNLRYPLIALFLDIEEPVEQGVIMYKLNLIICHKTDPTLNTAQRYDAAQVFKTTLYPLYEAFFLSLEGVGRFMWPEVADYPKHSKIDRPFWGKEQKSQNTGATQQNTSFIFNDSLDAIQIRNLEVYQRKGICPLPVTQFPLRVEF